MEKRICCQCQSSMSVAGEKFCRDCRKSVIANLESVGYLCSTKIAKPAIKENRDRSQLNWKTLGGSVERGTDGDDW